MPTQGDIPNVLTASATRIRETKMKQVLKLAAAPASAMLGLALLSLSAVSTPAAAGEFCRTDTSGMRG
jgi:hypothetical protein